MRLEQARRYLDETTDIEVGLAKLRKEKNNPREENVAFIRVKDIKKVVQYYYTTQEKLGNIQEFEMFQGDILLKLGGDKGGKSTKLCYQIANVVNCNSAEQTQMLSFFEATDSDNNLWDMFSCYTTQFAHLETAQGGMKNVRKFLVGDYKFLCSVFGHMGAGSKFPCLFCLVPLEHLRSGDGVPHSPQVRDTEGNFIANEKCGYTHRTLEMFRTDLANCRARPGEAKDNSKFHNSVYGDILFPVEVDQIAPLPYILGLCKTITKKWSKLPCT
jgi:hypothetical protein